MKKEKKLFWKRTARLFLDICIQGIHKYKDHWSRKGLHKYDLRKYGGFYFSFKKNKSGYKGHTVNALVLTGDEGRNKLR